MTEEYKEILNEHFPDGTIEDIIAYLYKFNIHLKITRKRVRKLGDYRPPGKTQNMHRISINGDLNQYTALLVFLHELAHLLTWTKYKNKVKPHGKEWKETYGELVSIFIKNEVFPFVLKKVLEKKILNLKASFSSDTELYRTLTLYDNGKSKPVFLEEVPKKTKFMAYNGKTFIKQDKVRKRFKCFCLENHKFYLFHPLAQIKQMISETTSESNF